MICEEDFRDAREFCNPGIERQETYEMKVQSVRPMLSQDPK